MHLLEECLERFCRKERNLVVRAALGHKSDRPLRLDAKFCSSISEQINRSVDPSRALWWTDFHISWLAGAVALYVDGHSDLERVRENMSKESTRLIEGNQEDIDLVVVCDTNLILIEAKGYSRFTSNQLKSKLDRLALLRAFYRSLPASKDRLIDFHLVLLSPEEPDATIGGGWPSWKIGEKMPWIQLDAPEAIAVTRCTSDGERFAGGGYWKIYSVKPPGHRRLTS